MKHFLFVATIIFSSLNSFSQLNYNYINPNKEYLTAKEYIDQKEFGLAYPILNELHNSLLQNNQSIDNYKQDINYYFIITSLLLNKQSAVSEAIDFTSDLRNQERNSSMNYYLGHYYFNNNDHERAVEYFIKAAYNNLGNEEIASLKFELAYSYFYLKNYEKAKPLFNEIHQLPANKYYLQSNYYYGFITYREKDYETALKSFKIVEALPEYNGIVPYYIAEIYYSQHLNNEALTTTLKALENPNLYYKNELNLLAAQIYFENKNYAKAIPYFENYSASSGKITKEILYEISYSYYQTNNSARAIEGFKQLSTQDDSLGQNAMYLLGDLYLKSNDKPSARNAFQYSANNSNNLKQQEISKFNYAKLSYELKYNDVALKEIKSFISHYPQSKYLSESKEILVSLLGNSNNYKEALSTFESIDQPSLFVKNIYPKLLFGRATELLNEQKTDSAKEMFSKIVHNFPTSYVTPYANFWLGEISFREERYDESINYIKKYLQSGVTQGEANPSTANYLLGYNYLKKQEFALAASYFDMVIKNANNTVNINEDAYTRLADSYFMMKEYDKAKGTYDKIVNSGWPSADYAVFQNAIIAGINSLDQKIQQLNTIIIKYPSSEYVNEANLEIANSYMAEEKFGQAIPYLNKIVIAKENQLKPKALLKLGLASYNLNENTTALIHYQKLLNDFPQSPEADLALDNMRNIYIENGHPDEYLSILKKAGKSISVSEADSITYTSAIAKYNNGDCNGAITSFGNYLESFPSGAYVVPSQYFRSECLVKNKNWASAAAGYEVAANSTSKYAESAILKLARINYVELKDYIKAKTYFLKLRQLASTQENKLEAMRGLVRCYYQTQDFNEASNIAKELLNTKNISTDDKSIGNLVLGKSLEINHQYESAIIAFKLVAALNKSAWGTEARFEIAQCYYNLNNIALAEKSATEVIKENGSSDLWMAKAYLLLGDIYLGQKDYFNAKATYQSVATNATIPEIKIEAQQKLDKAILDEKSVSKIIQ